MSGNFARQIPSSQVFVPFLASVTGLLGRGYGPETFPFPPWSPTLFPTGWNVGWAGHGDRVGPILKFKLWGL